MPQPPSPRPNLLSHGLLLAALVYASWWVAPYQHDPDSLIIVWFTWLLTGVSAVSYVFKLFRY